MLAFHFLTWVNNTVPFPLDKDNAALCLDKKRVHRGGKTPQRAGGAGESPRSNPNKVWICTFNISFEHFYHRLAVGHHSREDEQRCGGSRAEGAQAAVRPAGLRVPPGRGGGRRQRSVGKVHHQEGGQERRKKIHTLPVLLSAAVSANRKVVFFFAALQVDPEELTLVYNLRKLMKNDWVRWMHNDPSHMCCAFLILVYIFLTRLFSSLIKTGGAIISTLAQTGSLYTSKSAYLPQELLGEVSCSSTLHSRKHRHSVLNTPEEATVYIVTSCLWPCSPEGLRQHGPVHPSVGAQL